MSEILQFFINGLTIGATYALVALGFHMMWSVAKAANFTHGDIFMLGAVLAVALFGFGVPVLIAAGIAIIIAALASALIERVLVRPFNTEPNAIGWILTTIAIGIILQSGAILTYGSLPRPLPSPLVEQPIRFGGAGFYAQELLLPLVAVAVVIALETFYRRTTLGRAMRAVAFNRVTAGLMGINVSHIALFAFGMAGAVGALTGVLVAPVVQAAPTMGVLVGLKAFGVAIAASITHARGVLIVGLSFGVIEKFVEGYISTGARNAIGFSLIILALLIFPQGIFAKREVTKV